MSAIGDTLRWLPGSLSALELDRVLTDALADLFADAREHDSIHFTSRFREHLERAVEHATGIPCCGLPAERRLRPMPDACDENAPVPLSAVPRSVPRSRPLPAGEVARRAQGRFRDGAR